MPGCPAHWKQNSLVEVEALTRGALENGHSSQELRDQGHIMQEHLRIICILRGCNGFCINSNPKPLVLEVGQHGLSNA
jgi:hypothetical protein